MLNEAPTHSAMRDPPPLDLDPFSDENILDPQEYRAALRDRAPVVYLSKYDVYAAGRYEDVHSIFLDWERFSSAAGISLVDLRNPDSHSYRKPSPIGEVDPPIHTRVRSGLQKLLSPVMVRGWRSHAEEVVKQIVERALSIDGSFNAVPTISEELVYTLIPEMLGLDVPRDYLPALGDMNSFSMGPDTPRRRANLEAVKDALAFYQAATERKNVKPGTFSDKIYQAEDEGVFEPGVGAGLIRVFLRASTENQYSMISALIRRLAENPDQWAKLKEDPGKLKNAIEEVIRLDTPLEMDFRLVTRDTEFQGQSLQAGRKIGIFIASANRDPRFWDKPDSYDIDRKVFGKHLGFGAGVHACIGQMIARLQAEALLTTLLARVDRIELTGEPERKIVSSINSLKTLPIRLIPK